MPGTASTTTNLIAALAVGTAHRAAVLAELRGRGVWAQTTTLTADERADLLADQLTGEGT